MISMYDTVTVLTVPANARAVAGYVGGYWPTYSPLVERFPKAKHLSIAVTADEDAQCLDIERGDATPDQAPAWVKRQVARGVQLPVLYGSLSDMAGILATLAQAGIKREAIRVWTAHYTYVPHVCTPKCGFGFNTTADATQWTDHALNRNLDQSLCSDTFFDSNVIVVRNKVHYNWFDDKPRAVVGHRFTEHGLVTRYDHLRALQSPTRHPHRAELAVLRRALRILGGRVAAVARADLQNGKPSWGHFHRGWRYQQLIHRADGARLV